MLIHTIRRFVNFNQTIVVYGAVFCVAFLALFIGVIPSFRRLIALYTEIETIRTSIEKLQKKASVLSTYEQSSLEATYKELLVAVPADKSVSTLMATVETLATQKQLTIIGETIERIGSVASQSAQVNTKGEMNMTITVQGDLGRLREFFEEIIHVRRLVRVDGIEMSFSGRTQVPEAIISMTSFFSPLPSMIRKLSDTLEPLTSKQTETLEKVLGYPVAYKSSVIEATTVTEEPQKPASDNPFNPSFP